MKTKGIIEQIKEAKTEDEVTSLLMELGTYKYVSNSTLRRAKRKAKQRISELNANIPTV